MPIPAYIRHLRTFGCVAYVHRKGPAAPDRAIKMHPRAVKGYLIGYEGLHGHIYHIWIPDLRKVMRTHDVRFHDTSDASAQKELDDVDLIAQFDDDYIEPFKGPHEGLLYPLPLTDYSDTPYEVRDAKDSIPTGK